MTKVIVYVEGLLSPEEAQRALAIGRATIYRWIKSGKLLVIRHNGRTYIPETEITRLQRNVTSTTAEE